MNRLPFHLAVCLVALSSFFTPPQSMASEGGSTHYTPGSLATIIDLAPTQPGWVIEPMYLHYEGSVEVSEHMPIAGLSALGISANMDSVTIGGFYTLEQKVAGANYSIGAYFPMVWVELDASVETNQGVVSRHDSASGLGDITLIPALLAWKDGRLQYSAGLNIYAPTGEYELGRLANPGLNYWSFDPWVGVAYNNEKSLFNAALHGGITFNTENQDTDYTSGTFGHIEGSVQQFLSLGKGMLSLGVEAFWVVQLEADSGQAQFLGDFKGDTAGIGPVLGYLLPLGKETLAFELRWLPEVDVKNRLEGDYLWAKVVYQF